MNAADVGTNSASTDPPGLTKTGTMTASNSPTRQRLPELLAISLILALHHGTVIVGDSDVLHDDDKRKCHFTVLSLGVLWHMDLLTGILQTILSNAPAMHGRMN